MKIYFVRHGETRSNIFGIHQHPDTKLSETGQKQAQTVANRFKKIPIDIILTSPMTRAHQTAQYIHNATGKPLEVIPLLSEMKRPTEIEGQKMNDPKTMAIKEQIKNHADEPSWHYADEENFFDFRNRVDTFLKKLSDRKEQNIAVVSHTFTLRMILSLMLFRDELTRPHFDRVMEFFKMKNTGITLCEKSGENDWKLIIWNDHAHLG